MAKLSAVMLATTRPVSGLEGKSRRGPEHKRLKWSGIDDAKDSINSGRWIIRRSLSS
jgi:hypothetical protein